MCSKAAAKYGQGIWAQWCWRRCCWLDTGRDTCVPWPFSAWDGLHREFRQAPSGVTWPLDKDHRILRETIAGQRVSICLGKRATYFKRPWQNIDFFFSLYIVFSCIYWSHPLYSIHQVYSRKWEQVFIMFLNYVQEIVKITPLEQFSGSKVIFWWDLFYSHCRIISVLKSLIFYCSSQISVIFWILGEYFLM